MKAVVAVLVAIGVAATVFVLLIAAATGWVLFDTGRDLRRDAGVEAALSRHADELRAIPGVELIGTHQGSGEPAHVFVWVRKITPQLLDAVPATIEGYRVDVELEPRVTEPPLLYGVVRSVTPATAEQAAAGLAGLMVVDGSLYRAGVGGSPPRPRTLRVRVPAAANVWRPMGEGKESVAFSDIRAGMQADVTLTGPPAAGERSATASDVEVYVRD